MGSEHQGWRWLTARIGSQVLDVGLLVSGRSDSKEQR